ncbi:MAG: helix-turn-helix transcriptional regulator [Candidatus Humimicrobiaceae bacterium]
MKTSNIWRLLKILLIFSRKKRIKASDIAGEIEISVRQTYRDINSLKIAGIPIYSDKNGYGISDDFYIPKLNLELPEVLTIYLLINSIKTQKGTPYYQFLSSAFDKIIGVLPKELAGNLADEKIGFSIDFGLESKVDYRGLDEIFKAANQAFMEKRSAFLKYYSFESKKITEREVDIYGFKLWFGIWYLIGYCHFREEIRTFRIDRIRQVRLLDRIFKIPSDFDFDKFFEISWGIAHGQKYRVVLRFSRRIEDFIKEIKWHPSQKLSLDKDGSLIGEYAASGLDEIRIWILGFGEDIEVLEPAELKSSIIHTLESLNKVYKIQ